MIARNFSTQGLKNSLIDAITNSRNEVKLRFPNGSELNVPLNAIRDALQHQGVDTHQLLLDQPNIVIGMKSISNWSDEQNGDIRTTRFTIGDRQGGHGFQQNRNDVADQYDWSIVDFDNGNQVVRKLVSLTKNQDGFYEVRLGDNTEPDGLYPNKEFALYDIKNFITNSENIDARSNLLNSGREFDGNPTQVYNKIEPTADGSSVNIENLGINITKPEDAQTMQVFGSGVDDKWKRIGADGVPVGSYSIFQRLGYDGTDANNYKLEELNHLYKDGTTGELVSKPVYSIRKIQAVDGKPERYELSSYNTSDTGEVLPQGALVFDSLEDAKDFAAKRFARHAIGPRVRGNASEKRIDGVNLRDQDQTPKASADLNARTIAQDNQAISTVTPVRLKGGIVGELVLTVQKGKHPTWDNGRGRNYVFAEFEVRKPGGDPILDSPYFKGKIIRDGVRSWKIETTGVQGAFKKTEIGRAHV